jgi:hypothetical protein
MDTFSRTAGGVGIAILAGTAPAPGAHAAAVPVIKVTCSATALVNAVITANASPAVLRLAPFCVYNITSQLPQITGNVGLIGGPSTTIRHDPASAGNFRILDVAAGGSLHVRAVFLRNGNPAGNGGAVQNAGRLTLKFVTVSGNIAGDVATPIGGNGGGVANLAGGRAVIVNTVINGNASTRATLAETTTGNGGGIFNAGALTFAASRLFANNASSISATAGTGNGGGIDTATGGRSLVVQNTIAENTATNNGGGIFNAGTTSIVRTLVLRNRATTGGGIFGTVASRHSVIRGNVPNDCNPASPVCG